MGVTNIPVLDFCPGCQRRDDVPNSSSAYDGFLRFTSGATPADLLTTSMAAEPFLVHVLY